MIYLSIHFFSSKIFKASVNSIQQLKTSLLMFMLFEKLDISLKSKRVIIVYLAIPQIF